MPDFPDWMMCRCLSRIATRAASIGRCRHSLPMPQAYPSSGVEKSVDGCTTGYRSLQLSEGLTYHTRAVVRAFSRPQVRSYLFFFDLVMQDGSINDEVLKEIDAEW